VSDAPVVPDDTAQVSAVEALGIDLPDRPEEAIELLAAHVVEARSTADSYLGDLKRIAADFENYRKRADRDRADMVASASRRVATALLPVLDSLDAAAATMDTAGEERLRAGLLSTREQLLDTLAAEGVAPIVIERGQPFDPNLHDAVRGGGDGHLVITAELRRGYTMHDRLLRPAMVEVAAEDLSEGTSADGPEE
jgi:molecular chaperone GrpE